MADLQVPCPQCNESLTVAAGNSGMELQCPKCAAVFRLSADGEAVTVQRCGRNTASLVLGILSLIFWLLPILGLPVSIVGLVLGYRKHYTTGVVLNIIGLGLTLINSAIGAYMGATGQMFWQQ